MRRAPENPGRLSCRTPSLPGHPPKGPAATLRDQSEVQASVSETAWVLTQRWGWAWALGVSNLFSLQDSESKAVLK